MKLSYKRLIKLACLASMLVQNNFTLASDLISTVVQARKAAVIILGHDETGTMVGQGSGFVVGPDGVVVTNVHVLESASSAVVKFANGSIYEISGITAIDCAADLAVVNLKSNNIQFPTLKLTSRLQIPIGTRVFNIGNPLTAAIGEVSTEGTVSDGIISGHRVRTDSGIKVLQVTTPISSGNSGGPLLTNEGEVIGVMTFSVDDGQNLNFAVNVEHLKPLLKGVVAKPIKEMTSHCVVESEPDVKIETNSTIRIAGAYSGQWSSAVYDISGAVIIKINVENENVYAKALITGSPLGIKGDNLSGKAVQFSEGVWVVEFRGENTPLTLRAFFKNDALVGEYELELIDGNDRGKWELSR